MRRAVGLASTSVSVWRNGFHEWHPEEAKIEKKLEIIRKTWSGMQVSFDCAREDCRIDTYIWHFLIGMIERK